MKGGGGQVKASAGGAVCYCCSARGVARAESRVLIRQRLTLFKGTRTSSLTLARAAAFLTAGDRVAGTTRARFVPSRSHMCYLTAQTGAITNNFFSPFFFNTPQILAIKEVIACIIDFARVSADRGRIANTRRL